MSIVYGSTRTGFSKDGLIFHIDPSNPACFKDGDSTCKNLVSGSLVTGANGQPNAGTHTPNTANFPAYSSDNGGVFNFAGGKGMNVDENLGPHTNVTMAFWLYKTSTGSEYISDARNNGGEWFLSNYQSININYTAATRYNFDATYNGASTDFINKWVHVVVASDSSGGKIYLNGYEVSVHPYLRNSYVSATSIDEDIGKNFRIGTRYSTSTPWTGKMGPIQIYNRVLSAAEIRQNFEAYSGRFDL